MKSKNKKILSGMFSLLMVSNLLTSVPASAMEEEYFPYMFYAASENDGSVTVNAGGICFNGNAGAKGTISATAENSNINGRLDDYADIDISFVGNALDKTYFSNNELVCEPGDYTIEELNINVNVPMDISGNATLNGNSNINAAIKADGDISILGGVTNSNNAVLYSEFGDVIIDTDNVNFSGLIYAPNGDIKIDAEYVNLNSVVIIGQTITIDCPNNVNANTNYSLARYIKDASKSTEEEGPVVEQPEGDTLYAWAKYKKKTNSIIISWQEDDCPVHDVYLKGDELQLLGEVSDAMNLTFEIDPENARDEYVFVVEKTDIYGNTIVSNDVIVRRNEKGTYKFIDTDSDEDGLEDLTEVTIGTDRFDPDSDEDGLPDGYEYFEIQTDPAVIDTDENGIGDGDEDFEGDGLTNVEEYANGTDPYNGDTDEDGFADGYEVANGMDPLNYDQIVIDVDKASEIESLTEGDLEMLNMNEPYPLTIEHNENGNIKYISGVFSETEVRSAQDALYAMYSVRDLIGVDDLINDLSYSSSVYTDKKTTYTFTQLYKGIRVYGRTITVTANKEGKAKALFSSFVYNEELDGIDVTPSISEADVSAVFAGEDIEVISADLMIDVNEEPVLCYLVKLSSNETATVDAHTGEILSRDEDLYDYTQIVEYGKDESGKEVTFPIYIDDDDEHYMIDEHRNIAVYNAAYYDFDNEFTIDNVYRTSQNIENSDFDEWPDRTAISEFNNAIKTYDNYKLWFGYKGINGKGKQVSLIIHPSEIKNDSAYSPPRNQYDYSLNESLECITVYDKQTIPTLASRLDVMGHEYGHAIFYNIHGKEITCKPNNVYETINEAYADILGSCNNEKWISDIRNIASPNKTYDYEKEEDDPHPYYFEGNGFDPDYSDPHKNSTVISHAAYLMNVDHGFSYVELAKLFYESIPYIGVEDNMQQVRNAVLQAAIDREYTDDQMNGIIESFNLVGLLGNRGSAKIRVIESNKPVNDVKVTLSSYGHERITGWTDSDGVVKFDKKLDLGTYTVKVNLRGKEPITTTLTVKANKTVEKSIHVMTATNNFGFVEYQQENYKEPYRNNEIYDHIYMEGNDIVMKGYTDKPFKDMYITQQNDDNSSYIHSQQKLITFNIKRDSTDWHTMEGGGFIFDASIKDGKLTGNCILVTQKEVRLYQIRNKDFERFRGGQIGNIRNCALTLPGYTLPSSYSASDHKIAIRIDKQTREKITVWVDNKMIIDNLDIQKLEGDDFGPLVSYDSHCCKELSMFTFSDIQMSSISVK